MATAPVAFADPNNPAGEPPAAPSNADTMSAEILDVLGFDSNTTSSAAAEIAARAAPGGAPSAAPTGEPPAGGGVTAPAPAGEPSPQPAPVAPAPPATPEPAPAAPSAAPAAPSAAPATPPVAPQPPAVDEAALREASLRAQVDAMQRELETLRANPQTPAAPQSGPPAAGAEPQPIRYGLTLPETTTARLLSDNPQENVAAITQIINDFGTIVHNAVLGQIRQEIQPLRDAIEAARPDPQAQASEQAREAYYAVFPTHKSPTVMPLLQSQAQKMAAEFPGLPWNEQYINALGQRVNAAIAELAGGRQPEPAPAPTPVAVTPPARPAAMMPSSPRAAPVPTGDQSAEILDVLDPFN